MSALLLAISTGSARADVVTLTTNKAAGSEITMALNAGVSAKFEWGNGETSDFVSDGTPASVSVKAESLTITTEEALTLFYAPAAGITSLDVSEAPNLTKLFCQNNELTTLSLTKNIALTDLDCQGNRLTTLDLLKQKNLKYVNCAQNALTKLNYSSITSSPLTTLVCSENELETLNNPQNLTHLETFWARGNKLSTLSLKNCKELRTLNVSSNQLETLTLGKMPKVTDIWAENNLLTSLDLTAGTPLLNALGIDHNQLKSVKMDGECAGTLTQFYGHDNELFFNSFPTRKEKLHAVFAPQRPFLFVEEAIQNEDIDKAGLNTNAYDERITMNMTFTNKDGVELVKKKTTGDYFNTTAQVYTFYTEQKGVTITAVSSRYPDVTLTSLPFDVKDPTGIHHVENGGAFSVTVSNGMLHVSASSASSLQVHDAMGRRIIHENMKAGEHNYPLATGVYIVNGKKVLVP